MRRLATFLVLLSAFTTPASAQGTELMPGVSYEKIVQFTPHGPVVLNVITAPGRAVRTASTSWFRRSPGHDRRRAEPLTQIQRDLSAQATVAGINGDFSRPGGVFISGGVLVRPPLQTRSSIGIDASGVLHVDRVRFAGTWQGTGQRRPLGGVNQVPGAGQVVLFTPSYGAPVPQRRGCGRGGPRFLPGGAAEHRFDGDRHRDRLGRRRDDPTTRCRADGDRLGGSEAAG